MRLHRLAFIAAFAAVGMCIRGGSAHAQEAVTPPAVQQEIPAEYPAEAKAARLEGRVVLRLTIEADGHVSAADVVESAGHGFDESARAAALQSRFSPAQRGGTAVRARVLYPYEFRLPAEVPQPPAPAPVNENAAPAKGAAPSDVTVRGKSEADRLRESAQAVQVIETEQAKRQTADFGEVMARSQGVSVRREGGLGSGTRFSLNGLTDDQIRFFLDGVPLDLAGYPFGLANVPVNLVERAEVYRGVVPIRFGADALGGAVNLVTEKITPGTHGSASYQAGSFETHRATLALRHLDADSGFFARASGFFDYAKNDYSVDDVPLGNLAGEETRIRATRFHDGYRAGGANLETGFIDRSWAKNLRLRVFFSDYSKELQNNVVMTVPYGEAEYGKFTTGATVRYENTFATRAGRVSVDVLGGYTYGRTFLRDVSNCTYLWNGERNCNDRVLGEIDSTHGPFDQVVWVHSGFARANTSWQIRSGHTLRLSLSPTYSTRSGEERQRQSDVLPDPLGAKRDLLNMVSGLEYQADLFKRRLENIAFVKSYFQSQRSVDQLPGGARVDRDRNTHRFGVGDALRYRFVEGLYAKASYEWATRLPSPDELYGNGILVVSNLNLQPETSHNVNLGMTVDLRTTPVGAVRADINGFLRAADQLITLLSNDKYFSYQNVFSARSIGVEAAAGWTSPGEYVVLDGNVTYQDFRNVSADGAFGKFEGDRIPNRPYLFANASARLQFRRVRRADDELSLTWFTRYVHEFYRSWESAGVREYKPTVDSQLVHSVALTYLVHGEPMAMSFTGELQNITDERAYDFFGVQRPGRAFYFKTTLEF
ncbi:TonB-dependent siderophore myxochelin receptor MxcH [Pendulispora brunnea]|uniref:TonB-dependent siderophore myxochelin receptor MxcH n=1 Tax=Pendulispora brunnea TaxID=2905690 RepID=A0ABZ2KCG6_9BACT